MQRIVWLVDRIAGMLSKNRWVKESLYQLISQSRVLKNVLSSSASGLEPNSLKLTNFSKLATTNSLPRVSIILTVHNNLDAVERCVESLKLAGIPEWADLVIVDDYSNKETRKWLEDLADVTLIRNSSNLGYTRSVNLGISVLPENDVVLLNSDTVVPDLWLGNLRAAAYSEPNIGTVTPLTDRPGAFGIADPGTLKLLDSASMGEQRDAMRKLGLQGSGKLIEVPTGNGFCMFVKRATLEVAGLFDEDLFPIGYGEENYFCMSASYLGWKSMVIDSVVVHHSGSGSFGSRAVNLKKTGNAIVKAKFPEYEIKLRVFQTEFFSKKRRVSALNETCAQRVLLVNPILSGGTKLTNDLLVQTWVELNYEVLSLTYRPNDDVTLEWTSKSEKNVENLGVISRHRQLSSSDDTFDALIAQIVSDYSISRVHFAHTMWQSPTSSQVLHEMGRSVSFFAHDFELLCPSIYLLDDLNNFCGGTCTSSEGPCLPTFGSSLELPVLKNHGVVAWRQQKTKFLRYCKFIFAASEFTSLTLIKNVPSAQGRVRVLAHPATPSSVSLFTPTKTGEQVSVLIVGAIGPLKGLDLLKELGRLAIKRDIKISLLGSTSDGLPIRGVEILGSFENFELANRVSGRSYNFGLHLGSMPETFSRTLDELWSLGLPVLGHNLGAVGERISKSGAGALFDPKASAEEIVSLILDLSQNVESQIAMSQLALAEVKKRSSVAYLHAWASEIIEPNP